MSDHKHYVPVLRWKNAEKKALSTIPSSFKKYVTPLVELLPKRDYKNFTTDILGGWDKGLFVDASLFRDQQIYVLDQILSNNPWGVPFIPVIRINDNDNIWDYISVNFKNSSGICLRLLNEDINNSLLSKLNTLFSKYNLDVSKLDLLIDFKITNVDLNQKILKISNLIPNLSAWRNFTLLSGCFPPNLTILNPEKVKWDIPRNDWLIWKDIIENFSLPRKPSFGDYTIQYPVLTDNDNLRGSCSIRYTAEDHWLILRGRKPNAKLGITFDQYLGHAILLVKDSRFKGYAFSKGDEYIQRQSQGKIGITSPGNAESWLEAGINHHITLTANQVSSL